MNGTYFLVLFQNFFFGHVYTAVFIFGCAGFSLAACRFSLVAESRGYSPVAMHRLLIPAASLVCRA